MEVNPGALPRPGRVPEQEILVPRSLLAMATEIGIAPAAEQWTKSRNGGLSEGFLPGEKI